ncbi:porin family protein [Hymenobacter terrenus]|uniref:porin family protein n=1 Tax=Hymenobacter terrenus TaxID=1629124 RepID=UPI00061965BC|nr:porin family protein [Hymenobacter terrenus]
MKKTLFSLALLVAGLATTAHAQSGPRVGIKGGGSLSSFVGKNAKNLAYKPGFQAGVLFNFGLSDIVSLQPEVLYSQKGVTYEKNGRPFGLNDEVRSTLHYIDVPVLAKITAGGNDDGTGLFFELGPQVSFLAGQRTVNDRTDDNLAGPLGKSTGSFNKVAGGFVAGLGYQITSGLGLGLRYTGDFSRVYKEGSYVADGTSVRQNNPNVRNSVFQLQAHYLFGGK